MLPGLDGWSAVAALRRAGIETPILFLTARDDVADRVRGLELGADLDIDLLSRKTTRGGGRRSSSGLA